MGISPWGFRISPYEVWHVWCLLQEFHSYYMSSIPTTGVPSYYRSCILLQEVHPTTGVPSYSYCRSCILLQELHPTTGVPSYYRSSILVQEFLSYDRSSFPTTGVPFLLQELHSCYRSSFPTTGVPILLQEFHPSTGVPS